jgi:hypothetical protein
MIFFTGIQVLKHAKKVDYSFISINRFIGANKRRKDFECKTWIMDSGAFSQVANTGDHLLTAADYAEQIKRWSRCGILVRAAAQDYMCEDFILKKLGRTVKDHQQMTTTNYRKLTRELKNIECQTQIMPVLQGYNPQEYANHVKDYGSLLRKYAWVGVGSVCKRNSNPQSVADVLDAILDLRPDLRLHGFGIKKTCLQDSYISDRLFSADSMAWSFAARYEGGSPHDPDLALKYKERIETMPVQLNFL